MRLSTSTFVLLVMSGTAHAQGMTTEEKYRALTEAGIFEGSGNAGVSLDQNVTRADFARIVSLVLAQDSAPGDRPAGTVEVVKSASEFIDPARYFDTSKPDVLQAILANQDRAAQENALILAKMLNLDPNVDPGEFQAVLGQIYASLINHGVQLQLPGTLPPAPMAIVESNQAINGALQIAADAAQAALREAERRKQELLRIEQERLNQASSTARPDNLEQQLSEAQNAMLAARQQAEREAREKAEADLKARANAAANREDTDRRNQELALQRAQQAAALAAQQNAGRWPAWMTADSRYADLNAGRTTPELINFGTFYSGEARATDGQGNDIAGSFSAYFQSGPTVVAAEGVIFGLEFSGESRRGHNSFSATIYSGTTDLNSGTEEFYSGGTLNGHFYGAAGQTLGGTVSLTGDGSPNMSGHFVGVAP